MPKARERTVFGGRLVASAAGNSFGARIFGSWVAVSKWTGGTNWPRVGPFVSVLTGHTNANTTGACPCS